jgi:hypothetical protein
MKENLITFETAKLAKEKGFILGIGWHGFEDMFFTETGEPSNNHRGGNLCRPTQSLLQKWLREIHHIGITIFTLEIELEDGSGWGIDYDYDLKKLTNGVTHLPKKPLSFKSYEEALEYGLQEALKLIKIN